MTEDHLGIPRIFIVEFGIGYMIELHRHACISRINTVPYHMISHIRISILEPYRLLIWKIRMGGMAEIKVSVSNLQIRDDDIAVRQISKDLPLIYPAQLAVLIPGGLSAVIQSRNSWVL